MWVSYYVDVSEAFLDEWDNIEEIAEDYDYDDDGYSFLDNIDSDMLWIRPSFFSPLFLSCKHSELSEISFFSDWQK